MAFVSMRASPGLRAHSSASVRSRARIAQPINARCRPFYNSTPRSFYRNYGAWDNASVEAMKEMEKVLQDMAKQWKETGSFSGGFRLPAGGYFYGAGGCSGCQPCTPHQSQHSSSKASTAAQPTLALDVVETPEGFYLLFADVPGLSKADLRIKLSKERVLTISGERKAPFEDEKLYQQRERGFGAFGRQWQLPEDADNEGIIAKVADGVLTVTVPKLQPEPAADDAQDIFIL